MKKILLIIGMILSFCVAEAQLECGSNPSIEPVDFNLKSTNLRINSLSQSTSIKYFAIKFHFIRASNGTGGENPLLVNDLLNQAITHYSNLNIQFFQCGDINFINNDNASNFNHVSPFTHELYLTSFNVSDAINVFIGNKDGEQSVCGLGRFPWDNTISGNPSNTNFIFVSNKGICNSSVFSHELGHFFGLYHTHNYFGCGYNPCGIRPSGICVCPRTFELVDGSNCSTTGDYVCDTPADPDLQYYSLVNENTCQLKPVSITDAKNLIYIPLVNNIMSYSTKNCRTSFTEGQKTRIFDYISYRSAFEGTVHNLSNQTFNNQSLVFSGKSKAILDNTILQNNSNITLDICGETYIKNLTINLGSTLEIK